MRPALAPIAALALGCAGGSSGGPEAGVDVHAPDLPARPDGGSAALAVDFAVSGCPSLDPAPRCTGRAPLTLEFVPITTGGVTRFLWDFGDGTEMRTDRTPLHTYAIPGTYNVRLVGGRGAAETASKLREGFVVVTANNVGDLCEVDAQCGAGLACVCGSAAKCPPAFLRGLCAGSCRDTPCGERQVCVQFPPAPPGGAEEPFRRPLCLRACAGDEDCAAGLRCRNLPARGGAGWVRACFPDHPAAVGASCRTAGGRLAPELCVTGACVDLGAGGVCTSECDGIGCPPGTGCVEMSDGRRLCLRTCAEDRPCPPDALLACVRPNAGPLGFMAPSMPDARFCAPRRCNSDADCGAVGTCKDDQDGAHCVRRGE